MTQGKLNCRGNMDYKSLDRQPPYTATLQPNFPSKAALFYSCVKVHCICGFHRKQCDLVLLQRKINIIKLTALKF
jgi:hypothetical protein